MQEITFLKSLKSCPYILQYITAANLQRGLSPTKCEEFLLLTELCVASLYEYLSTRDGPYPPLTVARIFFQTLEGVNFMHRSSPSIAHRDLKVENLLVDTEGRIKLCDFGSATTATFSPDESWNMHRRTAMEEDLARFTTPMYRAPEMVDVWSDYPVNESADVWALGCLLFQLCFHRHPFEDGAKLRIINANFSIPEEDSTHQMFHDLIRQTLAVDPRLRPTAQQMLEHLGEVAVISDWDLEATIDFQRGTSTPPADDALLDVSPQHQHRKSLASDQHQPSPKQERPGLAYSGEGGPGQNSQSQQQGSGSGVPSSSSGFFSSMRGAGANVLGKVRESTKVLVGTLIASRGDLDISVVTSKVVCMSYPSEGALDLTYKNQVSKDGLSLLRITKTLLIRSRRSATSLRCTTPIATLS